MKPAPPPAGWAFLLEVQMNQFGSIFAFLLVLDASLAAHPNPAAGLDSLLADTTLSGAHVGVAVFDLTADSAVYCRDCGKLFIPASNMKLFTSAAALELLGPSFRFKTGFFASGEIDKKGRLKGDLVVVGSGDPLISGRFRDGVTEVLDLWADSLAGRGIKEIEGNIIIDGSYFTGPELGPGWSWNDLTFWYACPITALAFNDNCVDLYFSPGNEAGDPVTIRPDPPTDYIKIINEATTTSPNSEFTLDYYREPNTNDVTFFGGMPISDTSGEVDYVSVNRPDIYCAYVLADILKGRKIKFEGRILRMGEMSRKELSRYDENPRLPLFTWYSDSLGVVISVINKNSQNFFAEQTLKTVGREIGGEGSFKKGLELMSAFLDSIGIGEDDIAMRDGSGLSHYNIVKPSGIIELLRHMYRSPNFGTYYESMAIPGVDRSVRKRLENVPFGGNLRTKTGSIANVRTFSGYINGPRSGHMIAFSIMVNDFACDESYIIDWLDSVASRILAEY